MGASTPLLMVPFREVRHFQPDDCLHYEPLRVRGRMHRWTIPAHRHEALHQFELLERGSVVATIDGVSHSLASPAAWMVSPGTMHGFRYREASAGHVVTVPSAMLLDAVAALPHLAGRLEHPILVRRHKDGAGLGELRQLLAQLAREFRERQPGRSEALRAHAVLIALWFARRDNASAGALQRPLARDALVQRFRTQLESRVRARWTVAGSCPGPGRYPRPPEPAMPCGHRARRARAGARPADAGGAAHAGLHPQPGERDRPPARFRRSRLLQPPVRETLQPVAFRVSRSGGRGAERAARLRERMKRGIRRDQRPERLPSGQGREVFTAENATGAGAYPTRIIRVPASYSIQGRRATVEIQGEP